MPDIIYRVIQHPTVWANAITSGTFSSDPKTPGSGWSDGGNRPILPVVRRGDHRYHPRRNPIQPMNGADPEVFLPILT